MMLLHGLFDGFPSLVEKGPASKRENRKLGCTHTGDISDIDIFDVSKPVDNLLFEKSLADGTRRLRHDGSVAEA